MDQKADSSGRSQQRRTGPVPVPVPGTGHFHWSAGSWFGSLLGCTLWMLVAAGAELARRREVPWLLLAAYAASVALGVLLWRRRAQLAPYPAIQLLLAGLCVTSGVALLALRTAWAYEGPSLAYLAIFPGMLLAFGLLESRARRARSDRGTPS